MNSVTLPSGRISETGKREINNMLSLPLPDDWVWQMQVGGKGEYVGSLPKRIAKYYWQKYKIKLDSDFLGTIGSIASQHTTKVNEFTFDIVNKFDWDAGDFGDGGSCYWGCREKARELLAENDGQAIRFFDDGRGFARAWIMPHPNGLVCFNGYGLELSQIAHILAFHRGESYRKISLSNNDTADGLIWINGGAGFLIGQESAINGATRHDLGIPSQCCDDCGDYGENLTRVGNGDMVCEYCLENHYSYCDDCEEYYQDGTEVEGGRCVCNGCLEDYSMCEDCQEYHRNDDLTEVEGGKYVCDSCLTNYTFCNDCNTYFSETTEVEGGHYVCNDCLANYSQCSDCGDYCRELTKVGDGDEVCDDCLANYSQCDRCGDYHKTTEEVDGKAYCEECLPENVEVAVCC